MKISIFASAVVVSLAALTGAASASGIVPGSDTYVRAADGVAVNSVIRGETAAAPSATVTETRSFGFPASTGATVSLVPGSRHETRAADSNAVNGVIRGDFHGNYAGSTPVAGAFIPGSDSF